MWRTYGKKLTGPVLSKLDIKGYGILGDPRSDPSDNKRNKTKT
jgi:hypothetical protein